METIVVWFSCGVASAVAAKKTIEKYGDTHKIRIVNNPIKEEDSDNQRFLKDCEKWLGLPIEFATNPKYPSTSIVDVFAKRRFMSGPHGAPCTIELKKKAREEWERHNDFDYIVLGFTAEEKDRHEQFKRSEPMHKILPVLIDANISRAECFVVMAEAGIKPPAIYDRGYPNANCVGCVKATSSTYWALVREKDPESFRARAEQSREIGARLVRHEGKRLFLDELPDTVSGRPIKNMAVECGIFCSIKG